MVPPGFLETVCTVNENGGPLGTELESAGENVFFEQDTDSEPYREAVQTSGFPEETKQLLLLLLILWSQG